MLEILKSAPFTYSYWLLVKCEVVSPNSRYRAFYHEIGNIEKCPFTYWGPFHIVVFKLEILTFQLEILTFQLEILTFQLEMSTFKLEILSFQSRDLELQDGMTLIELRITSSLKVEILNLKVEISSFKVEISRFQSRDLEFKDYYGMALIELRT